VNNISVVKRPPRVSVDPFSDELLTEPWPFYEILHRHPVVHLEAHQCYAVGRYSEVTSVLTEHQKFTTTGGIGLSDIRKPGALRPKSPIVEIDPPEHTAVRMALQKILSPLVVRKWREDFQREASLVVERVLDMREVDGVRDIAEEFVLTVFPRALGIDVPRDRLLLVGELNFNQMGPDNARYRRILERAKPILEWYDAQLRREKMLPGGFGEQIFAAEDRGEFAVGTAGPHVRSFFRGGVDSTVAGIGFTLNQLARHPDQYAAIRTDDAKVRMAFEEGMRHGSPIHVVFRTTTQDTCLSGYELMPDTKVACYLGAANRDPRRWAAPDQFDIARDVHGTHLALGAGAHVCIGQMIARQEAESILGALSKRVKKLEIMAEPTYRPINALRTLEKLPLRLTPA